MCHSVHTAGEVTEEWQMATGTIYRTSRVSTVIREGYTAGVEAAQPETTDMEPRLRFARAVREARDQRGMTQDELAEAAGVTRPTIQRWETAKTGTPDPENARRVFNALGLDPRLIPVLLGYVTAEEMGLPPRLPRVFSPNIEQAIRILEDPNVPAAAKAEWMDFLQFKADRAAADGAPDSSRKAG